MLRCVFWVFLHVGGVRSCWLAKQTDRWRSVTLEKHLRAFYKAIHEMHDASLFTQVYIRTSDAGTIRGLIYLPLLPPRLVTAAGTAE